MRGGFSDCGGLFGVLGNLGDVLEVLGEVSAASA